MKKYRLQILPLLIFGLIGLSACDPDNMGEIPIDEKSMEQLLIPEDFTFSTTQVINLQFNDPLKSGSQAKYYIYLMSSKTYADTISSFSEEGESISDIVSMVDGLNDLVATKISSSGTFSMDLLVPSYMDQLLVRKNEWGQFSSQLIDVSSGTGVFQASPLKASQSEPVDVLYTVNGSGQLGTVNPTTGEMNVIANMPMGSWTAALDVANRDLYFVGRSSPYPLYKYNLDSENFTNQGNVGMGGPRLDFRPEDGLLYFSNNDKLYTIDPSNGKILTTRKINGLHNLSGGDLAFDADDMLYMCSFSGLYRLDASGDEFNAVRISGEGLPFNPTSMTFDSNSELWLAHTSGSSSLVVMDKITGGWETRYANRIAGINDLTTLPLDKEDVSEKDSDDDGIADFYDEFPNDPNKASVTYTPSVYGLGTVAFEDLWPAKGDYDFNDLVVNYKFITIANAQDEVVEMKAQFTVKNLGGSLHNGFGFRMPFDKSIVSSVTGNQLTEGIVEVDENGLEANQQDPVVIVTEDAFLIHGETIEITIAFTNPTDPEVIGLPPFDPFIFIGGDRGRELHLSGYEPTDLIDASFYGQDQDASNPGGGSYFKSINHLPWAIHIIHDFTYPIEKAAVNQAYLKFNRWAESGGSEYPDWYKDDSGFRNKSLLINK